METVKPPLSNMQLMLLELFSRSIPDDDLKAIRKLIATYMMERALESAEKVSKEKGYDEEFLKKLLNQD
ncbi:MAG: hypothetical protein ABI723_11650 [Bacteroidia bacterium]